MDAGLAMDPVLTGLALVAAGLFAVVNGLTDAPHAFGPPVRTGALTPRIAVIMGAGFTALGALLSSGMVESIVSGLHVPSGPRGQLILAAGAAGAAACGVVAHRLRLPSSSTHSLVGSLLGASLAARAIGHPAVDTREGFLTAVVLAPLLLSPWVAFLLAWLAASASTLIRRGASAHLVRRHARITQSIVAAVFSLAHGVQDGQRTVFLLTAVLVGAGWSDGGDQRLPLAAVSALLLGLGALLGSWRIARTLSHRMVRLDPTSASVGSGTAAVLLFAGFSAHIPLSSAHLNTAALLGAAESSPFRPTSWSIVLRIGVFWLAAPLLAAGFGGFLYLALSGLGGAG